MTDEDPVLDSLNAEPLLVLTVGGTIDKVYFDAKSDYEVGESVITELLQQAHVKHPFEVKPLMRKDSLEMSDADRQLLLKTIESSTHERVIITHGTDTMTDTANTLSVISDKTIVLTGALAPARFAQSDATFNIGMAFAAAQSLPAGVYIVMNGQVFNGANVVKDRANNRFISRSSGVFDV